MKFINALLANMKKSDDTSLDHLERNRVRSTLEDICSEYLNGGDTILEFEALPSALPHVIAILEEPNFLERYEFSQISDSLFQIREKEIYVME